jgi:hypothetical protein
VFCKSWRRAARSTLGIEDALLTDVLRWEFNSQEVFNESIKIRQNYNCGQGYPHCCKGFYLFIPASAGRCARAKFTIRELKFYYWHCSIARAVCIVSSLWCLRDGIFGAHQTADARDNQQRSGKFAPHQKFKCAMMWFGRRVKHKEPICISRCGCARESALDTNEISIAYQNSRLAASC